MPENLLLSLFMLAIFLQPILAHSRLAVEVQRSELIGILMNLRKAGESDTLHDALERANFTILGKTLYFHSRYPNWGVKTEYAAERYQYAEIIRNIINSYGLATPFVPTKILLHARHFDNAPVLLVEKIRLQECPNEVIEFYRTRLSTVQQAEVLFVILKSGIADTEAPENLPITTRTRLAFIDTAHLHDSYRSRLDSYHAFLSKLPPEVQGKFYTLNDEGMEDNEIGMLVEALTAPKDLLKPWAKNRSLTYSQRLSWKQTN